MRPPGPTFWLLDGRNGWRTSPTCTFDTSTSRSGIRLAVAQAGPLGLIGDTASLGGLVLPPEMAIDEQGLVYLLVQKEAKVKRFDPQRRLFSDLPGLGGEGGELRQFQPRAAIAVAGGNLYLADPGNRRLQVLDLETLTLPHVWGPTNRGRETTGSRGVERWEPVDLAVAEGAVYLLDRHHATVYRHRPGTDRLVPLFEVRGGDRRWSRIAVDLEGQVYLFNGDAGLLDVYSQDGNYLDTVTDPGSVRDRFPPPMLQFDHRGRFCIPATLMASCSRRVEVFPVENPLAGCLPPESDGLVFDRSGNSICLDPTEPPGPKPYVTEGHWYSRALDSCLYRCQWHRIELELTDLPVGSRVQVDTYSEEGRLDAECDKENGGEPTEVPKDLWKTHFAVAGPMQPPQTAGPTASRHEFLVQSREGRFLRLRLKLFGDGYSTPVVRSLRVHYPRRSYLDYLPALFAADDDSRWFLERFLAIFQTEWEQLEQSIDEMPGLFDPAAVPEKFIPWLAHLLGLPLEKAWSRDQQRRLLIAAPILYGIRGRPDGLRHLIRVYLANMTGLSTEEVARSGFPRLVEGFRERSHLMLSRKGSATLGRGAPLWGPAQVGRLQLDVFAREGEVRLVSTGDPQRDLFHEYAHSFRVFLPAVWLRSAADESMLRRAIDREKPAHTRYQLCLVESRFQIGVRSSLGLDTIIGDYPRTRLGCARNAGAAQLPEADAPPPSLPPFGNRLGMDTVLGGVSIRGHGLRLTPGNRLATHTRLI